MIETFTALLFAHVLADFVFQSKWMVANKRNLGVLLLHVALVLLFSQLATGQVAAPALLVLALLHLLIDSVKTYAARPGLTAYLTDQVAHILSLILIAHLVPGLWSNGLLGLIHEELPAAMALISGLILATVAGNYAIDFLMQSHSAGTETSDTPSDGLPKGGKTIGLLERGLIFVLILSGQIAAIGFLVAAKSILRFGSVSTDRNASEYVIIGTLASFGWAILIALGTKALLDSLPPLEIASQLP